MAQILAHNINEKLRTADIHIQNNCNFEFLLLSGPVLQGLTEAGFYKPSPIQLKGIPLGKCGLDLILKSKSGTGKTLVFAIVALEMIQTSLDGTQVLILAPTREIADQICSVITIIGKHIPDLNVGLFIGGLPYKEDLKRLKKCHIAVGAPGRIKHLIEAKKLNVKSVKLFVLDEADNLMDENFQNDINYCYHMLPENKQFLATSATVPVELKTYLERYMKSPTFISLEMDSPLLLGLRQFVAVLEEKNNIVQQTNAKTDEVCRLLSNVSFTQCIIFCNYQQRAESVSNIINQRGWKSLYISGAQTQETRLKVINKLKNVECNILLTTNLTARGIDASNVDLVINYDIPLDTVTYLHRVGRTGRYGSQGVCVSLAVCKKDLLDLQYILGDIGGTELSIAKLSTEIGENLWKAELNTFEQIYGLVDAQREKVNWNFLETTTTTKEEKKKKGGRKVSSSKNTVEKVEAVGDMEIQDDFPGISTDELLNNLAKGLKIEPPAVTKSVSEAGDAKAEPVIEQCTKKAKKDNLPKDNDKQTVSDPYAGVSTADLLKQLARGERVEPPVLNNSHDVGELINPADLYPWVPIEESVLSKKVNGTNLLDSDSGSDEEADIANEILNKKVTLTKNIALYHVGKLMKCDQWDPSVIQDAVQPIRDYLRVCEGKAEAELTKLGDCTKDIPNETLLENIPYYTDKFNESSSKNVTENICKVAYEHIIGGPKDWRDLVDNSYKKKEDSSPTLETETNVVNEHTIGDRNRTHNSYKQDEAETGLVNTSGVYDYYNAYQTDVLAPYEDKYVNYFDYYESVLSENALTFEDVTSFRTWFHDWQTQVKSLSTYVQQHLYLQEMKNNYHYNNY
ncbi:hypothetical protein RI129_008426 [Pyrocoelia pectoralis]|uniref:RNA helicase n=1 Tax=Pyrocoelia pectoralis TaxID=417401 RepID=A0AAN7VF84_9COLE